MALRDYGVAFSYNEISNVGTVGENIIFDNGGKICDDDVENMTCNVQENISDKSYLLSTPSSPECHSHMKHSSMKLMKYNMISRSRGGIENIPHSTSKCTRISQVMKKSGKKDSSKRAKKGKKRSVKTKIEQKSHKSASQTNMCNKIHISNVFPNSDDNEELTVHDPAAEAKLLVSELSLPKFQKNHTTKTESQEVTSAVASLSHSAKSVTISTLLSMMTNALSDSKYTSVRAAKSSAVSEYPEHPVRSTWPLLREMIAKPPASVVSISPVPRQTLSTVLVEPVISEEPKANVISKLEKEIRCECKFNKGQPCWVLFHEDRLRKERLHHLTLKRESLDLVILAKIAANINREEKTKKCHGQNRQRCHVCYYHEGRQICRETFMFIHGICKGRLCALMQHYKNKGLSVRVHGNKSNVPHHALSYTDSERVLDFIREYANNHCISSFGRKPRSKAGGGLLIMSPTQSKLYVHHKYKTWCSKNNHRAVSLRSFQNLWTKHLPYIVVLRGSNKNPVPKHESKEAEFELHDHIEQADKIVATETRGEKSLFLPGTSKCNNPKGTLKDVQSRQDDCVRLVDCGTNTHLDFYSGERKQRKRKGLPPKKVDASCLSSISTRQDFEHNHNFGESHLVHDSASGIHSGFNNVRNVRDSNTDDNVIHNMLDHSELHHSVFSSDLHVPEPTSTSPVLDDSTTVINFHCRSAAASALLITNKDTMCTCNNKTSLSKNGNLPTSLSQSQPSQLSSSYSIQCSDRFVPQISGSHGHGDHSQSVLLPHQGSDLSNVHQLDWQTWQTYGAL